MFGVMVYAATIFLSAMQLFLVQPIIAKQILPWFGGAASVWTTCLFFFQFMLLLGYSYAHALIRLPARVQPAIHGALLAASLLALPIVVSPDWRVGESAPAGRLLALLLVTVGAPYFLLAATSPLIQAWYARGRGSPYRLFALSNAASLAGLLAYPFVLEPRLTTLTQARLWSWGYAVFVICCAGAAIVGSRAAKETPAAAQAEPVAPPPLGVVATWIALAALASLLLVSVTAFITANVASAPLIWIMPLTAYLVTFILAFDGRRIWRRWDVGVAAIIFAAAMLALYRDEGFVTNYLWALPLFLGGLFFACLFCHGQLAEMKPPPNQLTLFYIMISAGGALGSLSGSVLAPALLDGDFEMPAALAMIPFLFAWQARNWKFGNKARIATAAGLACGVALLGLSAWRIHREIGGARLLARNFYSSLRVIDMSSDGETIRRLEHGHIDHGGQFLAPARRREPIAYFGHTSGVGLAIARQRERTGRPLSIGVIGLGAGVIAAYGEAGGTMRYYEINPQVVDIARREFSYLADCPARTSVSLGDGRLSLEREAPANFDILAIDAFSGDAIPMHLLTTEALAIYRRHLAPGGVLAFHISNKYVNLAPPLTVLANSQKLDARVVLDDPSTTRRDDAVTRSDWLIMAPDSAFWESADLARARTVPLKGDEVAWTDDFNNLLSVLPSYSTRLRTSFKSYWERLTKPFAAAS